MIRRGSSRVLLLLSGGADSHAALASLIADGWSVTCLTFDGKQHTEILAAALAAQANDCDHIVVDAPWFNEETRSAWRLIWRDLRAIPFVLRTSRRLGIGTIAIGVKATDKKQLRWLGAFLWMLKVVELLTGRNLLLPVWGMR
ncbi:MAG: hypothetical protein GC162_10395 [Planctomycetes bacterium]|nr:hypothetical protein [Planctomycetota bacterium]